MTVDENATATTPPADATPAEETVAGTDETRRETETRHETENRHETLAALVGGIALLMAGTPSHRHLSMADLEWLVLPAIARRQIRVFRARGRAAAYASWAFLTEEAEQRLLGAEPRLKPEDWQSGDRAWIIDLIAPRQLFDAALTELRRGPLAGRRVFLRLPAPGGGFETRIFEALPPAGAPDSSAA